jgi:large subunit ribosomal protein L23
MNAPAVKKTSKVAVKAAPKSDKVVKAKKGVAGKERLMSLLLAPHVTEKTSAAQQNQNQYTFAVRRDATRTEVRAAVELMFSVKVIGVQTVNEPGKTRRFGGTVGRTQDSKKAYVRLADGQSIDYEAAGKA